MKYRKSSKLKKQHHMIKGLRNFLEKLESWDEISSIVPGRISHVGKHVAFSLKVQYETGTGLKCIVRSGSSAQEVFFVSSDPKILQRRLEQLSS